MLYYLILGIPWKKPVKLSKVVQMDDAPQNSNGRPGVAVIKNRYKSSVGWKIALVYITFIVCCTSIHLYM